MIFDERDLEENNEEENKTPQKNQMMFDDLFLEKDKKTSKTKKTESKGSENIVSDKIVKKSSTRLNEYKKKKQENRKNSLVIKVYTLNLLLMCLIASSLRSEQSPQLSISSRSSCSNIISSYLAFAFIPNDDFVHAVLKPPHTGQIYLI